MNGAPDPAEVPDRGENDVRGQDDRDSATTAGAPYPPAHTQGDGPSRRAPRVPSSDPEADEEEEGPQGGNDA